MGVRTNQLYSKRTRCTHVQAGSSGVRVEQELLTQGAPAFRRWFPGALNGLGMLERFALHERPRLQLVPPSDATSVTRAGSG